MPKFLKNKRVLAIFSFIIVVIGTALVSFGNVAFLLPFNINAGGLNGIGIIATTFIKDENASLIFYNIILDSLTVGFFFVGYFFFGKDFALKTLIATITFPLSNALFTLVPGVNSWISKIIEALLYQQSTGDYLLAGLFGGAFVGFGVSLTFIGGGTTGGVDVLSFLAERYLGIKQSIASFLVDGIVVTVGLFVVCSKDINQLVACLCGILSVLVSSIIIDLVFIGYQTAYQVDIISDEWAEISKFAQNDLGRGATIIDVKGGKDGTPRVILRVVLHMNQYNELKNFIAKIDPKAFVTYTKTNAVFGEGFKNWAKKK